MKTRRFLGALLPVLLLSVTFNAGAQDEQTDQPRPAPKKSTIVLGAAPASDAALKEKLRAAAANLSPQVQEIVKMSDAGIDKAVIQQYVESSTTAYNPRSEELIYLHDHGIPDAIVTAMLQRGAKLREQSAAALASAAAPAAQPPSTYATAPTAPIIVSSPSYVYPAYTDYGSASPYCYGGYSYPYWPSFSFFVGGRPFHSFNNFHSFNRFGFHSSGGFHHSGGAVHHFGGHGALGTLL